MKEELPPPTFVDTQASGLDELPDFVAGQLIYYDPDDGCHWVVYDGEHRNKFASRKAAERFCIERVSKVNNAQVGVLLAAQFRTRQVSDRLGEFFVASDLDRTRQVHAIGADLRRISDNLDKIAAHFVAVLSSRM